MAGSTPNTAGNCGLMRKLGPKVTVFPEMAAVTPQRSINASAGSRRRSYQHTASPLPSGFTASAGSNWARVVLSSFTLMAGELQCVPPSVDWRNQMLPRSAPAVTSGYTMYKLLLTGLTTICGKELERKPPNPRSPLTPVPIKVVTVTVGPKDAPKSVDLRIEILSGLALLSYQKQYTAWSGPTTTCAP